MDHKEKIVSARSGLIYLKADGTAEKALLDISQAKNEFSIMERLYGTFPEAEIEGWRYKAIKPYRFEDGRIVMERVSGSPLSSCLRNEPGLTYHPGVWLALLHSSSEANNKVAIFSDTSLSNILIDKQGKTVVMLDPGRNFGRLDLYLVDLLSLSVALFTFGLKQMIRPGKMIAPLLAGYYQAAPGRSLSAAEYDYAADQVISKFRKRWSRRDLVKKSISGIYCFFISVYLRTIVRKYYFQVANKEK